MHKDQREFHLEEYKLLKSEVAALLARIEMLARYTLVAAASVIAWLVVQGIGTNANSQWCLKLPVQMYKAAWFIPSAFAILSALAALTSLVRVFQFGTYLRQVEDALGHPLLGWEKWLKKKLPIVSITGTLFWIAVIVATFMAANIAGNFVDGICERCSPAKS